MFQSNSFFSGYKPTEFPPIQNELPKLPLHLFCKAADQTDYIDTFYNIIRSNNWSGERKTWLFSDK
jgi:hypothetical protein